MSTIKTLHIIRHAKSSWKNMDQNDIDRPLKKRGIQDMRKMAQTIGDENIKLDLILTSPAVRAFESSKILVDKLQLESNQFLVKEKLYLPDFATLLKSVLYLNDELNDVAIVGHEPSLSSVINYFLNKPLEKVGTGSVTTLEFNSKKWINIAAANLKSAHHRNRNDFKGFKLQ